MNDFNSEHQDTSAALTKRTVLSISALNLLVHECLENTIAPLWIAGEVSNLVRASSGHIYFSLKDGGAQLRCTLWRSKAQRLPFELKNGMQLDAFGQVGLYEARGDYQFNVDSLRTIGQGNLFEQFTRLKQKLQNQGLFDAERKKPLPFMPERIAIICSLKAAALRDVLSTLAQHARAMQVVIYPSAVQGANAGAELAAAIATCNRRAKQDGIEAILLVRGGGSIEDLWAFNDEQLALAIASSRLPIISGVGHETDFTIADFVADARAPTPTAAATLISQAYVDVERRWHQAGKALPANLLTLLNDYHHHLDQLQRHLRHPQKRLDGMRQQTTIFALRWQQTWQQFLGLQQSRITHLGSGLQAARPQTTGHHHHLNMLGQSLWHAQRRRLSGRQQQLDAISQGLQHLNPRRVLERGYAIVFDDQENIIRSSSAVVANQSLKIELADGQLKVRTETAEPASENSK